MLRYFALRLAQIGPVVLVVSFMVFSMTLLLPGDPTLSMLGEGATTAQRQALRTELGLDLPLHFRAAKLVYLLIKRKQVSVNHWFYFADRDYIINRVAEFANFNAKSFADDKTVLCCEVTDTREFSVERVVSDLARAKLLRPDEILDTKVLDLSHAYPIYDRAYDHLMVEADAFYAKFPNLFLLGRQANFAHQDIDEIYLKAREIAQRLQAPVA